MPSISLTLPITGTVITAGLHSANYTALSSLLNAGLDTANWAAGKVFPPSKLTQEGATTGQVVEWNGTTWVPFTPPGTQLDYVEVTSTQTSTATTAATATAVVTGSAVSYDGATPVWIEFQAGMAYHSVANSEIVFELYDGATDLGFPGVSASPGTGFGATVKASRKLTPSNASHTYSIRMWSPTAGTSTVNAGTGGAGAALPMYLKITKA